MELGPQRGIQQVNGPRSQKLADRRAESHRQNGDDQAAAQLLEVLDDGHVPGIGDMGPGAARERANHSVLAVLGVMHKGKE
jgi:hypothetical protein